MEWEVIEVYRQALINQAPILVTRVGNKYIKIRFDDPYEFVILRLEQNS